MSLRKNIVAILSSPIRRFILAPESGKYFTDSEMYDVI